MNDVMLIPILLTVVLLTALLRLLPGWVWATSGIDMGYHLLLRREIRRNRMRMPPRVTPLMNAKHIRGSIIGY